MIAGAVVILLAGLWFFTRADQTSVDENLVAPANTDNAGNATDAAEVPVASVTSEGAEPSDAPATAAPIVTSRRFEPDGTVVIAGRADPGGVVRFLLDKESLGDAIADAAGNFAFITKVSPSDQPRELTILADPDGAAVAADQSYIIAPVSRPDIAVAETEATPEATAEPVTEPGTETSTAAVLINDAEGVRVLEPAITDTAPEVMSSIALDAITYAPSGEVVLSGRAASEGFVRIYLNNLPIITQSIGVGGDWQSFLPEVETGLYTLRVDQVDPEGDVVSRIETPFKREAPAEIAAVMADEVSVEGFNFAVKTVQPGATLWAIAREKYGQGIMYVQVFEANRDRIRDPDLIYPGQVFILPE